MISNKKLSIAILSLADIENYGDTFFPFLFRAELAARLPNAIIELYTNMEFDCGIFESKAYSSDALSEYDAVILAGGDTIQRLDREVWNPIYKELSDGKYNGRPTDIVFSWLNLPKPYKAWFSVGVNPHILAFYKPDVEFALERLDYLSVRGIISKKTLEYGSLSKNNTAISIVPDLGWMFPKYIDAAKLETEYKNYAVFETTAESPAEQIAKMLIQFQINSGLKIVLLPVLKLKNTYEILKRIYECSDGKLILAPNTLNFLETGTILKNSEFFMGGSMHGAVTCLAYGKPAANLLPTMSPKMQELHGMRARTDCLSHDWNNLNHMLEMLNTERTDKKVKKAASDYCNYIRLQLSRAIDDLCERISI